MPEHKLEVVEHETERWLRVTCSACGAVKTVHRVQLEDGEVKGMFDKIVCTPPPPVTRKGKATK